MTRDPLDNLGPGDRGLIELFSQLTSEPSTDELSGEYAALTMFRAARRASASPAGTAAASTARAAHAAPRRPASPRLVSRARVGARLAAAATAVALAGGFAAAGYAEVLPSPLQHLVHQILGFAGVPNSPGKPGSGKQNGSVTSHRTTPASGGSRSHPSSSSHGRHPSASPSPSRSAPVVPTINLTEVSHGHGKSVLVIISIPLAQRGDVVRLEYLVQGRWRLASTHRLHRGGQTQFSVVPRKISVTYRVVLPATDKHTQAVSDQVKVAAHPKKGGSGRH